MVKASESVSGSDDSLVLIDECTEHLHSSFGLIVNMNHMISQDFIYHILYITT